MKSLNDEQVKRLRIAAKKLHAEAKRRTRHELLGEAGEMCEEVRIATDVALTAGPPPLPPETMPGWMYEWGGWVRSRLLAGDSSAFERMAKIAAHMPKIGPDGKPTTANPKDASLKELGLKRGKKGATFNPKAVRHLFACAAYPWVMFATFRKVMPSAKTIRDNANAMRQEADPGAPLIDGSQFKDCVDHYGLTGLLDHGTWMRGPRKGSRQIVRVKRKQD